MPEDQNTTPPNPTQQTGDGQPQRSADGTILAPGTTSQQTASSQTTQQQTQTTETKSDPTKSPSKEGASLLNGDQPDPNAKPNYSGAPDKYADFKVPEGQKLDTDVIAKASPIFKELNLSQDGAQRLVDLYNGLATAAAEAPMKLWADTQKTWQTDSASRFGKDIEPGGKIITAFARAIDAHLPPTLAKNFRSVLDLTGAGNHPDFIEAFYTFARQLGEGTSVRGAGPSPLGQSASPKGPPSIARAMYPHLPSSASDG
jgi:hypothetical protein